MKTPVQQPVNRQPEGFRSRKQADPEVILRKRNETEPTAKNTPDSSQLIQLALEQTASANKQTEDFGSDDICQCFSCLNPSSRELQMSAKPIQLKNDMQCKATIKTKSSEFKGVGKNNAGLADYNEGVIKQSYLLNRLFNGMESANDLSPFGCAEPAALANAVAKVPEREKSTKKASEFKVEISDAIMLKAFPAQNLAIGDVKPRCKNCNKWIPKNKLTLV